MPAVEISAREMYDMMRQLSINVAILSEKIDRLGDHEARIRTLESHRWPLPVLAGLAAAAAVFVVVKDLLALG